MHRKHISGHFVICFEMGLIFFTLFFSWQKCKEKTTNVFTVTLNIIKFIIRFVLESTCTCAQSTTSSTAFLLFYCTLQTSGRTNCLFSNFIVLCIRFLIDIIAIFTLIMYNNEVKNTKFNQNVIFFCCGGPIFSQVH